MFVRNFLQLDIDLSVLFAPVDRKIDIPWIKEEQEVWSHENDYLKELYSEAKRTNVSRFTVFVSFP